MNSMYSMLIWTAYIFLLQWQSAHSTGLVDAIVQDEPIPNKPLDGPYLIYRKRVSWGEALVYCEENVGQLATFPTMETAKSLIEKLFEISEKVSPEYIKGKVTAEFGPERRYWIGLTDLTGDEGKWTWMRLGQPLNYQGLWYSGQPDHVDSKGNYIGRAEHCVALWNPVYHKGNRRHTFADHECSNKYYFICQKDDKKLETQKKWAEVNKDGKEKPTQSSVTAETKDTTPSEPPRKEIEDSTTKEKPTTKENDTTEKNKPTVSSSQGTTTFPPDKAEKLNSTCNSTQTSPKPAADNSEKARLITKERSSHTKVDKSLGRGIDGLTKSIKSKMDPLYTIIKLASTLAGIPQVRDLVELTDSGEEEIEAAENYLHQIYARHKHHRNNAPALLQGRSVFPLPSVPFYESDNVGPIADQLQPPTMSPATMLRAMREFAKLIKDGGNQELLETIGLSRDVRDNDANAQRHSADTKQNFKREFSTGSAPANKSLGRSIALASNKAAPNPKLRPRKSRFGKNTKEIPSLRQAIMNEMFTSDPANNHAVGRYVPGHSKSQMTIPPANVLTLPERSGLPSLWPQPKVHKTRGRQAELREIQRHLWRT